MGDFFFVYQKVSIRLKLTEHFYDTFVLIRIHYIMSLSEIKINNNQQPDLRV